MYLVRKIPERTAVHQHRYVINAHPTLCLQKEAPLARSRDSHIDPWNPCGLIPSQVGVTLHFVSGRPNVRPTPWYIRAPSKVSLRVPSPLQMMYGSVTHTDSSTFLAAISRFALFTHPCNFFAHLAVVCIIDRGSVPGSPLRYMDPLGDQRVIVAI